MLIPKECVFKDRMSSFASASERQGLGHRATHQISDFYLSTVKSCICFQGQTGIFASEGVRPSDLETTLRREQSSLTIELQNSIRIHANNKHFQAGAFNAILLTGWTEFRSSERQLSGLNMFMCNS